MSATNPIFPERRQFAAPSAAPLWIGVATIVMVVIAVGQRFGLPIYRQQVAIQEIERLGGVVETQEGGPELLRGWIGDSRMSIFDRVICVRFEGGDPVPDAGLAELKWLANPEGIRFCCSVMTCATTACDTSNQ